MMERLQELAMAAKAAADSPCTRHQGEIAQGLLKMAMDATNVVEADIMMEQAEEYLIKAAQLGGD